jgi:hypothetical protein
VVIECLLSSRSSTLEITDGGREVVDLARGMGMEGTILFHHIPSHIKGRIWPGLQPRIVETDSVSETSDFDCDDKTDI